MMPKTARGRILRVKRGYNPNSSSIGSIVFAVPTMLLISSAIFGTATSIIFSKFFGKTDVNEISKGEAPSKGKTE